ncbi:hypothetical protein EB50_01192 [Enterococcus faecium]|uniref:DUF5406 family protein n=1 Tax=Enterococcus faecium TaxID=1352 RepID=UPI000E19145E|nr:DUF5406 family protein [Enterococcus faecium]RBS79719.1 hypothetical protein EB50_01192 [Enterococcus faecium]
MSEYVICRQFEGNLLTLESINQLTDNPIGFGLLPEDDEGNESFKMTLTNDEGDELLVEDVWEELGDYIVGLEIIAFVADKEQ